MLKRQIFGLVGFELLRKRVLLSVSTAETTGREREGPERRVSRQQVPLGGT